MTILPLRLKASPYELPISFASRLACKNQCRSLYDFALDLAIDPQELAQGDLHAIERLRHISSLPNNAFSLSTPNKCDGKSIRVGLENYRSNIFARGNIRFCPECIADDIRVGGAVWHAKHRFHWQIRLIANCVDHHCPLITVRARGSSSGAFDPSTVFIKHRSQIGTKEHERQSQVGAYEVYLSHRAYGQHHPCWADRLDIFALSKASVALGLLIEKGPDHKMVRLDERDVRRFSDLGFQIIKDGPAALRRCWDVINFGSKEKLEHGRFNMPQHFGAFQTLLASNLKYKAGFAPLRRVFRDYLIKTFPFAEGADVLGQKLQRRRLHSVLSAQRAIGKRASSLHEQLVTTGFAKRGRSGKVSLIKPLTVANIDRFADEINGWLYERDASAFLGVTVESFRLLQADNLIPASRITEKACRRAFKKCELLRWKDGLLSGLPSIEAINNNQSLVTKAPVRLNCDLRTLVAAILDGRICPTGLWKGVNRIDHILIDVALSKASLPQLAMPNGMKRIATFRMLRFNNSTLNHLIDGGFLRSFQSVHPESRLMTEFISNESIKIFNQKFVSLGMLAHHHGAVGGPQFAILKKAGMYPAIDKQGLSKIYRRSELDQANARIGLELTAKMDKRIWNAEQTYILAGGKE